jgi:signal peptidase II
VTATGYAAAPVEAAGWVRRLVVPAFVATLVVAVDQASKAAIVAWLGRDEPEHRWELAGALLAVEYVENTGAAFGSFRDQGAWLIPVALAVVVGLVVYYRRVARPSPVLALSLGLLIGGALGNLIDRWRLGYVVDFVAVGVWPKFNVADAAVSLGVVLLAWHALLEQRASPRQAGVDTSR